MEAYAQPSIGEIERQRIDRIEIKNDQTSEQVAELSKVTARLEVSAELLINNQDKLVNEMHRLNTSMDKLNDQTHEVVSAYRSICGFFTVAGKTQRVLSWVVKWPLIITGIAALTNYITTHIPL